MGTERAWRVRAHGAARAGCVSVPSWPPSGVRVGAAGRGRCWRARWCCDQRRACGGASWSSRTARCRGNERAACGGGALGSAARAELPTQRLATSPPAGDCGVDDARHEAPRARAGLALAAAAGPGAGASWLVCWPCVALQYGAAAAAASRWVFTPCKKVCVCVCVCVKAGKPSQRHAKPVLLLPALCSDLSAHKPFPRSPPPARASRRAQVAAGEVGLLRGGAPPARHAAAAAAGAGYPVRGAAPVARAAASIIAAAPASLSAPSGALPARVSFDAIMRCRGGHTPTPVRLRLRRGRGARGRGARRTPPLFFKLSRDAAFFPAAAAAAQAAAAPSSSAPADAPHQQKQGASGPRPWSRRGGPAPARCGGGAHAAAAAAAC
jgi:hypothetical protein